MQQLSSTIRMVSKSIKFNWNLIFLLSQTAGSAVLPKQLELLHLILLLYKVLSFEMGLFKSLVNCTSCPHELSPMRKHMSSRLKVLRTSHRNNILGHLKFYLISPGIVEIHQKIVSRIFCKKKESHQYSHDGDHKDSQLHISWGLPHLTCLLASLSHYTAVKLLEWKINKLALLLKERNSAFFSPPHFVCKNSLLCFTPLLQTQFAWF